MKTKTERRRQIEEAADTGEWLGGSHGRHVYTAWIKGAEWADSNPSSYTVDTYMTEKLDKSNERADKFANALKDIIRRGKGNGGAVFITTETLRGIARAALEGENELK